ncbi:MAG TPA: RDD family protein [Gaiellaceae bacterium]|nr:RDD family protein [Gaiellaceae bacterium]
MSEFPAPPPQPPPPGAPIPSDGPSGPRASFFARFGAVLVDGILLSVIGFVIRLAIGPTGGGLIGLALGIAYFGYLEGSSSGQTVGKRAVGIRVIDFRTGGPIGFGRAVIRYFARILSFIPCLLGYFWMLWDKEKQTWHDKLATDVVVPVSSYPVESWPN